MDAGIPSMTTVSRENGTVCKNSMSVVHHLVKVMDDELLVDLCFNYGKTENTIQRSRYDGLPGGLGLSGKTFTEKRANKVGYLYASGSSKYRFQ